MSFPPVINGSVHDPHAHKRTSINVPLGPISSSSAIEHGLSHQSSSYSNGHYAQSTYSHSRMSPAHNRATNGTAYKYNPSWDRDMPSPRGAPGAVPSLGAYHRTQADGFSEPSVWSSPAGHMDAYGPPTITQSSYSAQRTSIPNYPSATTGSLPYPSRPISAMYSRPELPPFAYPQWPLQPTAGFGMCSAHPVVFHCCCHPLGVWPHHAHSGVPAMHSFADYPYPQNPPLPYSPHPTFYSPISHPDKLYSYMAPQREGENRGKNKEEMRQVNEEGQESENEDKNGEINDNEDRDDE